jgi:GTPase SAR1 family protein
MMSFNSLESWIQEIKYNANETITLILVGNKAD